ncbi:MAG: DMT family transporter, partial [Bacteroidaceae bacterium]|nr:DMT family transporter [Bacteroidaceae bacterium]
MNYLGEFVSLGVSMFWTVASLASEVASRRLGVVVLNVWRMLLTLTFSVALLWIVLGTPIPIYAGSEAWMWLLMSGVVGYFFGDWFLFNSYVIIGSRFGQLIMTLSPAFTALAAWIMLGQQLSLMSLIAMTITLGGIAISIIGPGDDGHKMR